LTPLKSAIFDLIAAAGQAGISSVSIIGSLYFDRRAVSVVTIKAHIWQINSLLVETDYRIISNQRSWFLVKLTT
jgi:hypothetical protein